MGEREIAAARKRIEKWLREMRVIDKKRRREISRDLRRQAVEARKNGEDDLADALEDYAGAIRALSNIPEKEPSNA